MLKSKNILLRHILEDDLGELLKIKNSDFVRNGVCSNLPPMTLDEFKGWYKNLVSDNKNIRLLVTAHDPEDRCLPRYITLGMVGLYDIDLVNRNCEFGIYLGEYVSGKGIGSKATDMILNYAFNQLNMHKVYLYVLERNEGARRCYLKVGFREDAVIREHVYKDGKYQNLMLMSILKQEYKAYDKNRGSDNQ